MKKRIFIISLLLAAVMIINAQDQPAKSSAAERLATIKEKRCQSKKYEKIRRKS